MGQHGTAETASKMVDILGQWCNQYSDMLVPACLMNTWYNLKFNFNLASIGLFLKQGFTMSREITQGIILQKDNMVIEFDIKIETPCGVLRCGYFKHG